jgi:acetyltransferase
MRDGPFEIDTSGIEYFFYPRSIAIIGASSNPRKPGGRPLAALQRRGYEGKLFPVNPHHREIGGAKCFPSILDVPDHVDMAIISVPADSVLDAFRQCAEKEVRAAVVFTAGFAEIGGEGEDLQRAVTDLARGNGIRILGPNSLGLINLRNSVMASFAHIVDLEPGPRGTLGFVTQSGAFGAMMYSEATDAGVGFSSFTSVGNEADAEFSDFLAYLIEDEGTELLGGYLEGAKDGAKLRAVAERAMQVGKPITIMKVGRTRAGARAAASHTGSLAGDDQIYDAFFRQMGIVRIEELGELVAFAILHRSGRSYRGGRVAILSGSGGHGVVLADKCESLGLTVPEITGTTRTRLEEILPHFGSARNPVDLTAQAGIESGMLPRCLRVLAEDDGIDAVLAFAFFHNPNAMKLAREIVEIHQSTSKPIVLISRRIPAAGEAAACIELVTEAGIPLLWDSFQAARAVAHMSWYQEKVRRVKERAAESAPPRVVGDGGVDALIASGDPLSEFQCKRILKSYGIPVTREALADSAQQAVDLARELGAPVALKVQSGQILHKTEADAIRLDLGSDDEVRSAYDEIMANASRFAPGAEIEGVLVQEMTKGGVEVIIGTTRDPVFGHVIMFGLGGIFVEALRDVSFRVAPVSRGDAEEMIEEIRGRAILRGARGREPADLEAIVEAILSVSRLVTERGDEIEELDINPFAVFSRGAKAVDALVRTRGRRRANRGG